MKDYKKLRTAVAESFICAECFDLKKSKNSYVFIDERICNGCYGYLKAQDNEE